MFSYLVRRIAYAFPILLGVNILLFLLFFFAYTPEDMAETILGEKRVTQEQIDNWMREHNYHLPRFINLAESFPATLTRTIFWQKSMHLFALEFGHSDVDNTDIGAEIKRRIPYSLCVTLPVFMASLMINIMVAMVVAFYRATYIDHMALVICVLMMSISLLFYIIGGQYLFAIHLRLAPVSGFDAQFPHTIKFLILPIVISLIGSIGGGVRYYRTIFLEEINRDYVRTARAKGLGEGTVLFKHALRNALLPILTNVIVTIPFLIMGSLLLENFFGIPGLGNYTIDAISKQDFAVIRAMVFLGSLLYIGGLILVEISYTIADPRIRIQ
ncbi:MAG: ABC transporter permease [Verrucomicrobia bacterium]|jgi:peptide/nickel transport system permease protein|nr:ABC transporter permease [Verrucomicrobiota bacterium]MBT7702416.1 ABC transporter permease [Verrucomicrobiota bacterium]